MPAKTPIPVTLGTGKDPTHLDIHDILLELGRNGQGAFVLLMTSRIEAILEELLKFRMPQLSKTMRDRLFSGFGPFASLSAKIDVAFAMVIITAHLRDDLHVARKIRNEFAHPKDKVHFDVTSVADLLRTFRSFDSKMDKYAYFGKKTDAIIEELNKIVQRSGAGQKQKTSPKKSD